MRVNNNTLFFVILLGRIAYTQSEMRKLIIIITIFVVMILPVKLKAIDSYVVMDSDSGRVLGSSNMNERMLVASTSKIMTAIVALENYEVTDVLCAGDEILEVYGSMIYIDKGECMTLYDILVGLMLRSGNDAAMVIATNTLGYDEFINKMNETASRIGMKDTVFQNPHGLDDKTKNYSTAYDMALLMRYATKNKLFMEITKISKYTVTTTVETHLWHNKNELLGMYKFATSGKTGYTDRSGYIFVSSASKAYEDLIVVTMKDQDRFNTHKKMYEEYFNKYDRYKVLDKYTFVIKEDYYKKYHLYIKDDVYMMLNKSELDKINVNVELVKKKKVKSGDIVGSAKIYVDGEFVEEAYIYALDKNDKFKRFKSWLFFWK